MKRMSILLLLGAIILFSFIWQGYTMARLLSQAEPITNVFAAPEYDLIVTEDFDGTVKENVQIQGTGDIAQYLRVQMIATLQDEAGNTLAIPISLSDFSIEGFDKSAWVQIGDYYYYKTPLQPDDIVTVFDSAQVKTSFSEGQIPTLIITAQGIQTNAAEAVWNITLVNGSVTEGGQHA